MMSEMVERVARALMEVTARRPADTRGLELPILDTDPDFDDLPLDHTQGTEDDPITQEGVLRLARAAIAAMREPTSAVSKAGQDEAYRGHGAFGIWQAMIDEALR